LPALTLLCKPASVVLSRAHVALSRNLNESETNVAEILVGGGKKRTTNCAVHFLKPGL